MSAIALNLIKPVALALLSWSGVGHEYQEKLESRHAATEEREVPQYEKQVWLEAVMGRGKWGQEPES